MGLNGASRQARYRAKRASEVERLKARIAEPEAKPKPATAAQESARNEALLRQLKRKQAEIDKLTSKPPRSESTRNASLLKRNYALELYNGRLEAEIANLKSTHRSEISSLKRIYQRQLRDELDGLGHRRRRRDLVLPKKVHAGILKCLHPDTGPHVDAATRNALTVEFLAICPRRGAADRRT
jgi:hypothetical protein